MSIIQWDDSLAIGHAVIDAQHKELFALTGWLYEKIMDGREPADLKILLMEVYKYTLFHFGEEEKLMHKGNYSGAHEHQLQHEEFIRVLDNVAAKARQADNTVEKEVLNWLVAWLVTHISLVDRKLAQCLELQ